MFPYMEEQEFEWTDQKLICNFLANQAIGFTSREIEEAIGRVGSHRRLSEMEKMGLARKSGSKICSVTGKKAAMWFTDDSKPKPPTLKKQLTHELRVLCARVAFLEKENEALRKELDEYKLEEALAACN